MAEIVVVIQQEWFTARLAANRLEFDLAAPEPNQSRCLQPSRLGWRSCTTTATALPCLLVVVGVSRLCQQLLARCYFVAIHFRSL